MTTQADLIEVLEQYVDKTDVSTALLALARLCNEKAEDLRCDRQDEQLAKTWDRAARAIDRFSTHAAIVVLP